VARGSSRSHLDSFTRAAVCVHRLDANLRVPCARPALCPCAPPKVKPPRVGEAGVAMECRVSHSWDVTNAKGAVSATMFVLEVSPR